MVWMVFLEGLQKQLIGFWRQQTWQNTNWGFTMSKRAIILAGGLGTRLRPYTVVLPKPLMPIGQYPILEVIIRQLSKAGFDHVTLAVNHQAEIIKGDKFLARRSDDVAKKSGIGKGTNMQIWAIKVVSRVERQAPASKSSF